MAFRGEGERSSLSLPTVLVAGEIFVDLLMLGLDSWPKPGKEIFAHEFKRELGGGSAITACALARLGCASEILAVVGRDSSAWIGERLRSCGVSTGSLTIEYAEPTGLTVIASRPVDRAFITYRGANGSFPVLLRERVNSAAEFPKHVHISAPLSLSDGLDIISKIHSRGATVSLDVGWNESWFGDSRATAIARHVDIFFPNEVEARAITGEQEAADVLRAFAGNGIGCVALKLGAKGAALLWNRQTHFVGAHPVHCVDTTGAGDCFDAGFLQAWLAGADPIECLRQANICGALSTEAYGGINGSPDLERLHEELRKMAL